MGFPSPATDYIEARISLDKQLVQRPHATYFMRAGISQGALLIVDSSLTPCGRSVVVCRLDVEFQIRRFRKHPITHYESLHGDGRKDKIDPDFADENDGIFGVVTHAVNDMRTMEFDDVPVI